MTGAAGSKAVCLRCGGGAGRGQGAAAGAR